MLVYINLLCFNFFDSIKAIMACRRKLFLTNYTYMISRMENQNQQPGGKIWAVIPTTKNDMAEIKLYYLAKISIRAKSSISRVFTLFIVPSPFFVHCPYYLLTDWLACLYGRIQSPRPDVMSDRREGITRAAGYGFACIDTQAS